MITVERMKEIFDNNDDYLEFDKISFKLSNRRDLHAFMLLDKLIPGKTGDLIAAAEHDEYFLDVELDELAKVATESTIIDLVRCGVRVDEFGSGLCLFA